jgi:GYF domain 2
VEKDYVHGGGIRQSGASGSAAIPVGARRRERSQKTSAILGGGPVNVPPALAAWGCIGQYGATECAKSMILGLYRSARLHGRTNGRGIAVSDGWHYAQGQKSIGPLDLSKMQEVLSKASNPRNILVWKVGFKEWKRAEDVPELARLIYEPPPLPPDQLISPETTAMNEAAASWIRGLPRRWALGGLVLGLVWSFVSGALQNSFANPVGGHLAGIVRVFSMIVLPLCVLGFVWGWSEKVHLERWSSGARLEKAINRYVLRQIAKAIVCGAFFGLFTYGLGSFRSFRPWDSEANIAANIFGLLGFALLAAPVGLAVGIFSRRNLRQRLSNDRVRKPN